jgi:hypothetical protein
MPLPKHLKVTLNFRNSNGALASVALYYRLDGGDDPTSGSIDNIANDFLTAFTAAPQNCMTTTTTMLSVVTKWNDGVNEVEATSAGSGIAGDLTSDICSERSAVIIQRRTGKVGRNRRGRIFWPFVPETLQAGGALVSTAGTEAYQGIGAMIRNPVTADSQSYVAVQPDFKTNQLFDVTQVFVVTELGSRRDRSYPKKMPKIPAGV